MFMRDRIREAAQGGRVVFWEEAARDGAQAQTLLPAAHRVALARRHAEMFRGRGPEQLIFAAGFPSVCHEEFEAVRQLAGEVDGCVLATHGRATREDVELGLRALAGAAHGRLTFFVPLSDRMSQALLRRPARAALAHGLEIARLARDRAGRLAVDVALADASRADPGLVGEAAARFTAEGLGIVKLCDSVGDLLPGTCHRLFRLVRTAAPEAVLGCHLHNDLGLGIANTVAALDTGVRVLSSSWLGLGERAGLPATEQLLFLLVWKGGHATDEPWGRLWDDEPDLAALVPLARGLAAQLSVPLRFTDPVVGTGLNQIATGTPFHAPEVFRPFDPETVLGVAPRLVLTQLASRNLLQAVAEKLGVPLTAEQAARALAWVKSRAFAQGRAVVPEAEVTAYLAGLTGRC
jgi:2-isopropylmalate synthase